MDESQNSQPQNNPAEPTSLPASDAQPTQAEATVPAPEAPAATEQPTAQPAAAETTPKAKKSNTTKIVILLCCIGGGVIILVVLAIILLPMLMKVDYSESYKTASQLDKKIDNLAYGSSCEDVIYYYDDYYVTDKNYNGYIDSCIDNTEGLDELVNSLGETSGIKRNNELQQAYNKFKAVFDQLAINSDSLAAKLELYKTWHSFVLASHSLDEMSNDSSFNNAASILTESNNEKFKEYGAKWLEYELEYNKAYRAYFDYAGSGKFDERRQAYYDADEKLTEFIAANEPDVKSMAPIKMENIDAAASRFQDLYKAIAETYSENYNEGSNDCDEFFGEVDCSY